MRRALTLWAAEIERIIADEPIKIVAVDGFIRCCRCSCPGWDRRAGGRRVFAARSLAASWRHARSCDPRQGLPASFSEAPALLLGLPVSGFGGAARRAPGAARREDLVAAQLLRNAARRALIIGGGDAAATDLAFRTALHEVSWRRRGVVGGKTACRDRLADAVVTAYRCLTGEGTAIRRPLWTMPAS